LFYAVLLFVYISNISDMFIYGTRNFHSRCTRNEKSAPKTSADFRREKMESIYGAGFWFLERVSWALEAPQTVDRIDCSFVHGTVKSTNIEYRIDYQLSQIINPLYSLYRLLY